MRVLPLAAAVLVSCGDNSTPSFTSEPGITSVSGSTGSSGTGASTTSTGPGDDSAGSAASTSTGILRDVGAAEDFGPSQPPGCQGKVDLLFVISRLGTMITEQEQLVASFPGFVDTIKDTLADFDVHIMVANPDGTWPGWTCETSPKGCPMNSPDCSPGAGYQCGIFPDLMKSCDEVLGAGLTFNVGPGAANERCDLFGGNSYIISGEPDLDHALECIAKVGWAGPDPPLGEAMVAALSHDLNKDGGCNAGFLRKDALLVVTFISDTADEASSTWPYQWYDAIITAKQDSSAVVMLGVVPQLLVEGRPKVPGCTYEYPFEMPGKLRDLIDMFPFHAYGDTCATSYAPFFEDAAGLIGEACGSFVPQ